MQFGLKFIIGLPARLEAFEHAQFRCPLRVCLAVGYLFLYNIRSLELIRPCIQGRNTLKSMKFVKSWETVDFQGRFSL